jgi:intein/homing endonuclease
MRKLNLPNDKILYFYLDEKMSVSQIARRFGCSLRPIRERLKNIQIEIRKGGWHYTKKFSPMSVRIPNSQEKLAYLAGIIDSEGTVGFIINKKRSRERVAPRFKVGNTNYRLITWLRSEIGGRVYKYENGRNRPIYEWFVSGIKNIQPLLKAILPYLVVKQDSARAALNFCQNEIEKRGGICTALCQNKIECENVVNKPDSSFSGSAIRESRRRMRPIYIPSSQKLAYLAGIIDGDGSIDFIINKKRRREKVAPRIRVANTDTKLIRWLEKEIGGYVGGVTVVGKNKPCYQWLITGEQNIKSLLHAILSYLIIKRENADEILNFYQE